MLRTAFFTTSPVKKNATQRACLHFIDVGGEPFHAIAVALVDSLNNASRLHEPSLKKILEYFFTYYPQFKVQQAYLTPVERIHMLLSSPRKSELVECMAFVLRQLAVDELYAHPLRYREVFDGLHQKAPRALLRQPTTRLPVAAVHALAHSLDLTIILSHVEYDKGLRKREVCTDNETNKPKIQLTVQVQGEQFFPGVYNKSDFAYVGQLAISPPAPKMRAQKENETIADIIALIETDNKRLSHNYQQWRQNLLTMIDSNELSTLSMMDAYIKFLPATNGVFARLTASDRMLARVDTVKPSTQQLNELLAGALAAMISVGEIEADQLFDRLDIHSQQMKTPAT